MSKFNVNIGNRDYSIALSQPLLQHSIKTYSWSAIGGPDIARINVTGGEMALWSLINKLRCPIEIQAVKQSEYVWWGFINQVLISNGNVQIGVSLNEMFNRVAVTYSYVEPGSSTVGTRRTTTWAEDTDSSGEYGDKELLQSLGGATVEQAEQLRDTLLDQRKNPVPKIDWLGGKGVKAVINCKGWWHSLGWTYFSESAGKESHEDYNNSQNVGEVAANTKVEQSFQTSTAWVTNNVKVRLWKEGSPTDNALVKLYSDSGGNPNTLLATGTIAGSSIGETMDWETFELDSTVSLAATTTYHIVVERSGSLSATNFYRLSVDEALGYASGSLQLWGGAAWGARTTDADMAFQVLGELETSEQIENIITDEGQFISSVTREDDSDVYSSQYRDGDLSALAEIKELLADGTSNDRRMLATVKRDRRVNIYEEPASGSENYLLYKNGKLTNHLNALVLPELCKVGILANLKDIIPVRFGGDTMANPSPLFIEHAEYTKSTGKTKYTPRGIPQPWDLVRAIQ